MGKNQLKWSIWLMLCLLGFSFNACYAAEDQGPKFTLTQAIETAMKNSLQRELASREMEIAKDKLAQAQSGYFPKLTLSGGYTHFNEVPTDVELGTKLALLNNGLSGLGVPLVEIPDQSLNYYGLKVSLEQPLYTGNRLGALNKQARANEALAQANFEVADQSLIFEVKKAYYTVITAQRIEETMHEAVNSMEEHLKEADAYYRAGMVPKLDLMRAEVKLSDLKQKWLLAQNGVVLAKMALNFVMGIDLNTDFTLEDQMNYIPLQYELKACEEQALANRPEIVAIKAKVEMAKQAVEVVKSGSRPIVALRADDEDTHPYSENPPISISVVASMKLYDGGLVKNQVAEAEATLKQAGTVQELITRGIKLEVEQAYRNIQAALEAIQVAEGNQAQAKETLHMAEVSYKAGLSSSVERIDAEVGLTQAKTNYTQALSLYQIALAQLEKAMGNKKGEK